MSLDKDQATAPESQGTDGESTGGSVDKNRPLEAVNPSTVKQRSPFRYPGGKAWLVPIAQKWLSSRGGRPRLFEPFAGGGIIGLTAAFDNLVNSVTLVELDENVAAVWRTILYGACDSFVSKIQQFDMSHETVQQLLADAPQTLEDKAFLTLVRNRISRGGVTAPGAGILNQGENGKGLGSRWYPETLCQRIQDITKIKGRIQFIEGNGLSVLEAYGAQSNALWFIDPPYVGAGRRLYTHSEIDHEYLFHLASRVTGDVLMTYDETDEIVHLAEKNGLRTRRVAMKTSHHKDKYELLIGRSFGWL